MGLSLCVARQVPPAPEAYAQAIFCLVFGGFRFWALGLGFWVWGLVWLRAQGSGFRLFWCV